MYSSLPCVKSKHRLPSERGERVDICFFRLSLFLSVELRSAINVAEERLCKHSCFFPPFRIIVTGISFPPRPRYLKPITADPFGQNHIFIRIAKPLQSCVCACAFHVHFIVLNVQVCFFLFFFSPLPVLRDRYQHQICSWVPCYLRSSPGSPWAPSSEECDALCCLYNVCINGWQPALLLHSNKTYRPKKRKAKQSKQLPAVQQNFSGCFAFVESGKHLICLCVAFWVFLHKGEYQRYNTVLSLIRNVFAALQDQDRLTILLETLKK